VVDVRAWFSRANEVEETIPASSVCYQRGTPYHMSGDRGVVDTPRLVGGARVKSAMSASDGSLSRFSKLTNTSDLSDQQ
jgi:hypothetical protein